MKKNIIAILMAGMMLLNNSAFVSAADDFSAQESEIQIVEDFAEEDTEISEEPESENEDEITITDGSDFASEDEMDLEAGDFSEDENTEPLSISDEEAVRAAAKLLTWDLIKGKNTRISSVMYDLNLPTSIEGYPGITISWSSSDAAISPEGKVTRPDISGNNISNITLTATVRGAEAETSEQQVTFSEIKVLRFTAYEANLDKDVQWLNETWAKEQHLDTVKTDLDLPVKGEAGATAISWSSSDPSVIDQNGIVGRPEIGGESVSAILTATLKSSSYTRTAEFDVTVLPWTDEQKKEVEDAIKQLDDLLRSLNIPETVSTANQKEVTEIVRANRTVIKNTYQAARKAGASASELNALDSYVNYLNACTSLRRLPKTLTVSIIDTEKKDGGYQYSGGYFLEKSKVIIAGDSKGKDSNDVATVLAKLKSSGLFTDAYTGALVITMHGEKIKADSGYSWHYAINGTDQGIFSGLNAATSQTLDYGDTLVFYFVKDNDTTFCQGDYATGLTDDAEVDYDFANPEIFDASKLDYETILNENDARYAVKNSLNLPTRGKTGSKIVWTSSSEIVDVSTGEIKRQETDTAVTLIALIGTGSAQQKKSFDIVVKAQENPADQKTLGYALEQLILEGIDKVTGDIELPAAGFKGADISWSSDNEAVLSSGGKVNRQETDVTVKLTATVTVNEKSGTKEFLVTVLKRADTDKEKLEYDKATLTFEKIRGNNESENSIKEALSLPETGAMGTFITWSSDNEAVTSDGKVTRSTEEIKVVLTALLKNGEETDEVKFNLKVAALTEKEQKRSDAEKAIEALPDAIKVTYNDREELEKEIKNAEALVDEAVKAGYSEDDIKGMDHLSRLKKKLSKLPVTLTFSILGADIEFKVMTHRKWLIEPCKLLVPAGSNVSDITQAILKNYDYVRPGSGQGYYASILGLTQFEAGKGSGWIYSGKGEGINTSVGSKGSVPGNGSVVYWAYVGDMAPNIESLDQFKPSESLPDSHPIDRVLVPPTDTEELQLLLDQAKGLVKEDYRNYGPWSGSWEKLQSAISEAEKVLAAKDSVLNYEIDDAVEMLQTALQKMQLNETDKTTLRALVEKTLGLNKTDYYKQGWEKLQTVLEASREVLEDEYAGTDLVNSMVQELQSALDRLIPVTQADKTELQNKLEESRSYKSENYSLSQWKVFEQAVKSAEEIMADEKASQEAVDGAAADLTAAIKNLVRQTNGEVTGNRVIYQAVSDWKGTTDAWSILDLAVLGRLDVVNEKGYLAEVTTLLNQENTSVTDLERTAIVLTAMGYDVTDITMGDGSTLNLLERISENLNPKSAMSNALIWALTAADAGSYDNEQLRSTAKEYLLSMQCSDGGWPLYRNGRSDLDLTAMAVTALAPYSSETETDQALAKAFAYMAGHKEELTGNPTVYKGNCNTTAMAVLAYVSAPSYDKNNVLSALAAGGLRYYVTEENQLGYKDNTTANMLATEQGVRAYTAYSYFREKNNSAFNIYKCAVPTLKLELSEVDFPEIVTDLKNQTVTDPELEFLVSAHTSDGNEADVTITFNGKIITGKDGVYRITLTERSNTIAIQAVGKNGAVTKKSYGITLETDDGNNFQITFSLYGDSKHGKQSHGQYECWIPSQSIRVPEGATVKYVTEQQLNKNGISFSSDGSYVSMINDLSEFDNGRNSGWMYSVNGEIVQVGYADCVLKKGDVIQWFYTDDYTKEDGIRYAASHSHTWDSGKITTKATCTGTGIKTYTCTICKTTRTETVPATGHQYGSWKTAQAATVFRPESQVSVCSVCGQKQTRDYGEKLNPVIKLNATTIPLQVKQSTSKVKVTMANGDSVKSWTSSNKKIVTVSKKGVIKAGKKTGAAKITVTLASGKKATLKVKVQKAKVKTTKITGLKSKVTMKKGEKLILNINLQPLTTQDKVTCKTSNKKVATVNNKGVVTAKKKGTAKITVTSGGKKKVIKVTVK